MSVVVGFATSFLAACGERVDVGREELLAAGNRAAQEALYSDYHVAAILSQKATVDRFVCGSFSIYDVAIGRVLIKPMRFIYPGITSAALIDQDDEPYFGAVADEKKLCGETGFSTYCHNAKVWAYDAEKHRHFDGIWAKRCS